MEVQEEGMGVGMEVEEEFVLSSLAGLFV